jgi:hypothetical protein
MAGHDSSCHHQQDLDSGHSLQFDKVFSACGQHDQPFALKSNPSAANQSFSFSENYLRGTVFSPDAARARNIGLGRWSSELDIPRLSLHSSASLRI